MLKAQSKIGNFISLCIFLGMCLRQWQQREKKNKKQSASVKHLGNHEIRSSFGKFLYDIQMNTKATLILLGFVGLMSACAPQPTTPIDLSATNFDGLQEVKSKYFSAAFVRPGINFSDYRELLLSESELAFRTPDRTKQEFPLTAEQKNRFRELLDAQFADEFASSNSLKMTASAGPKALKLDVRVQDIVAMVPPRSVSGVGNIALQALAEATLVIEISDSESEEILARVYDRRVIEGTAIAQKQGPPVTQWEEVEKICNRWASTVRARLDVVVSGNY